MTDTLRPAPPAAGQGPTPAQPKPVRSRRKRGCLIVGIGRLVLLLLLALALLGLFVWGKNDLATWTNEQWEQRKEQAIMVDEADDTEEPGAPAP